MRYVDIAAPWLAVGRRRCRRNHPLARRSSPASPSATTTPRPTSLHDDEFEAVIHPLAEQLDVSRAGRRRLRRPRPAGRRHPHGVTFDIPAATRRHQDVLDRSRARPPRPPGADPDDRTPDQHRAQALRPPRRIRRRTSSCAVARSPIDRAGAEVATLRDKYEAKVTRALHQREAADGRADVLREEAEGKRNSEMLSTRRLDARWAAGRTQVRRWVARRSASATPAPRHEGAAPPRRPTSGSPRPQNKVTSLDGQIAELERRARSRGRCDHRPVGDHCQHVTTMTVGLEKTDVKVTQICLAWIPVASAT